MPAGRPSAYDPEFVDIAGRLAEGGATDADIARELGINITTVKVWKAKHPEFRAAIKLHKEVADAAVEASLYNRAMGYSHEAVKFNVVEGQVVETQYVEHYPPDTTAMIFWLKNRRPAEWREKQEIATEVTVKSDLDLSKLSADERDAMRAMIMKAKGDKGPE